MRINLKSSLYPSLAPAIVLLFALPNYAFAKFSHVYPGIAYDGLQSCLNDPSSTFTRSTITLHENCRDGFACIMQNIDNSQQSILSAGSSTLGFIPTVLTLIGSPRSDIMAIHSRSWILALLLSLTGVNIDDFGVAWKMKPQVIGPVVASSSAVSRAGTTLTVAIVHLIVLIAACGIAYQTYDLGQKAVLSWACWTWFYPMIWLGLSILQHLLSILTKRLDSEINACSRRRMLGTRLLKIATDAMGMVAYIYGTIVFASLTLVSGQNAVEIVAVYGALAIVSRGCAAWVLDMR